MEDAALTRILRRATAAIEQVYFLLPLHGEDPVYRERVYCYELYHQMRQRWPRDSLYYLNGEIDKAAHPYFDDDGAKPKPDLLVHIPGSGNNYAIIEVKPANARADGISKDLKTMSLFRLRFGYRRAMYLVYGEQAAAAIQRIKQCATNMPELLAIELWVHSMVGQACQYKGTIGE